MAINIDRYTYTPTREHGIVGISPTLGAQFEAECRCGSKIKPGPNPSAAFANGRVHVLKATEAPPADSEEPSGTERPAPAPRPQRTPPQAGTKPPCACLCGGTTGGGRYLPGHDSRHLKNLTERINKGEMTLSDAMLVLEASPKLAAKLAKRLSH
jgi:hypothetical protein